MSELESRVAVVKELTKLFQLERFVYLSATALAAVIILVVAGIAIHSGTTDTTGLTMLFGSSGIVGFTGNRLIKMWTNSLEMVLHPTGKPHD